MSSSVKPREDVLTDILKDARKDPHGWKAVVGKDHHLLSNDYYLFHPNRGLYLLKEYEKNPVQTVGVGARIARHVDDDICHDISSFTNDFGIIHGDIRKIIRNMQQGIHPSKIFSAAIEGRDLGLSIPLRGQASETRDSYRYMRSQFASKQKNIDKSLEKLANDDGLYQSHM
jgi:hypothetical protein